MRIFTIKYPPRTRTLLQRFDNTLYIKNTYWVDFCCRTVGGNDTRKHSLLARTLEFRSCRWMFSLRRNVNSWGTLTKSVVVTAEDEDAQKCPGGRTGAGAHDGNILEITTFPDYELRYNTP